jgi:hypothetical protein
METGEESILMERRLKINKHDRLDDRSALCVSMTADAAVSDRAGRISPPNYLASRDLVHC